MKFLLKYRYVVCAVLLACSVACSDDDDKVKDSPLTPEEHKVQLEQTGRTLVGKIKPEEQETAINAVQTLTSLMQDESFAELFSGIFDDVTTVVAHNDVNGLIALATDENVWQVADFYGKYTYTDGVWTKEEADDRAEFNYTVNGKAAQLVAKTQGELTEVEGVKVPNSVDITLTVAGNEELALKVNGSLASDRKSAKADVSLTIAKAYRWSSDLDVAGDKATAMIQLQKGDERLISVDAELRGNQMTDPDYTDKVGFDKTLTSAKFEIKVLDLVVKGNGNLETLIRENEGNDDWVGSMEGAEGWAATFNKNAKAELFYKNGSEKVADIVMVAYLKEEEWGEEYYAIKPCLKFTSDEALYDIDSYFSDSTKFADLIRAVQTLVDQYVAILNK